MIRPRQQFECIVHTHQSMLYRIAVNFFRNPQIAEEVVQDVLLRLFEADPALESPAHVQSWLRRAVIHRCIDLARRKSTRLEIQVEEMPDIPQELSESDPLRDERLRLLVGSLPEAQQLILILRFGEDMNSEEISGALEMPSATVRSYLQRALTALRERLPAVLGEIYEPTRK